MYAALKNLKAFLAFSILFTFSVPICAWDTDLELFDLVEEIPQSFYEFLSVEQDASSADIRKAYRRLSLTLHPDKNKDENAELQFRQLVSIYEVLKDEERRQSYNDILVNGLPDWRQPVFYYRRVRKMSNGELGFLLFLILTVGHYAVIWSIYLEKQLDELLSKKKKEKKKKLNSKSVDESKCIGQDKAERCHDKPHWQDILPLKLSIWLYLSLKSLPQAIQDMKQYYEDYKQMKIEEKEEAQAMAEQETTQKEKRPKVKKPKFEFPVYEPAIMDTGFLPSYDQGTSIEEIEDQMDHWLDDSKSEKKKQTPEWTEEDISLLTRSMAKFPGGTPGRWEKIAHELGRSVTEVTTKVKQVKDCVTNTSGMVKLSELKGTCTTGKATRVVSGTVPDSLITQRDNAEAFDPEATSGATEPCDMDDAEGAQALRRRPRKTGSDVGESKVKNRRQKDFDPAAVEDSEDEQSPQTHQALREKSATADDVWTQNQQKLLELALQQYPRGTSERWDKIAMVVPGKRKEECMIRYKLLAELVQKRKQAKS
ncbi:dnaJ homolog subfamily C member 1 isoform X1 [Hypomesus transpacificus]|uniref:dnaJ homolog subfamily C member 1 isoform X1 n=1 Tax=Hypomesus transpacificus TaxID=137520 RepID=UPI001F083494|nr:dnaJ homolog subfamily C member 1 isoform X1 [Hypomesus transpacificus]